MNMNQRQAPRIVSSGWGNMEVHSLGRGRDFKLWPGGGRPWDWGETGTSHSPGIQVADVEELVKHGCRTVILGCGVFSRLKVMKETLDYLDAHGIETIAVDTKRAIRTYNEFLDRDRNHLLGGLIHTTC